MSRVNAQAVAANPLLQRREELSLSQREIAGRLGLTAQQIWNWEHDRSAPRRTQLVPLAKAYEVTIAQMRDWLVETAGRVLRHRMNRGDA